MKSALSYKAAVFQSSSMASLWTGRAVDRQSTNPSSPSPDYWIKGFLASDFLITPAAGTRRLAVALKNAIVSSSDLEVKQELIAASTLARRLGGQPMSVDTFCRHFQLTEEATSAVRSQLSMPSMAVQQFNLDTAVFDRELAYRVIELDTGAIITAPAGQFDGLVERFPATKADDVDRLIVKGKVIDEKLRKGLSVL